MVQQAIASPSSGVQNTMTQSAPVVKVEERIDVIGAPSVRPAPLTLPSKPILLGGPQAVNSPKNHPLPFINEHPEEHLSSINRTSHKR